MKVLDQQIQIEEKKKVSALIIQWMALNTRK